MSCADSADTLVADSLAKLGKSPRRTAALDRAERLIVLLFYLQMVVRLIHDAYQLQNPLTLLLLPSEGIVIALILIRRPARELTTRWGDWTAALGATALPTLVVGTERPEQTPLLYLASGLFLMGLIVQIHAKLALGRTIGMVPANRGIRVAGPYQWIRHPMYLGYLMAHLAFITVNWCAWNVILLSVVTSLQLYRMDAEESLLRSDPEYLVYQDRVRYRLLPGLF